MNDMKRQILVVLAENKPGVLNRVTSLCRQRQFNVESLTAGYSEQKGVSHMTIVVDGGNTDVDQMKKQLYKLMHVLKVTALPYNEVNSREIALIRVKSNKNNRAQLLRLAETFEAKAIDVTTEKMILEVSATTERIDSFLEVLKEYGIEEMRRTGIIAMAKC